MTYSDFTQMPVWQKAFKYLVSVYKLTKDYPSEEKFGFISDMRRAANSVAHNVAEGFGRYGPLDKTRFYKISRGSSYELISQILVSYRLDFIAEDDKRELENGYRSIIDELDALIKSIEQSIKK